MLSFVPVGAIFDLDDTLLDNQPASHDSGLHEQARLLAVREAGERHGIDVLASLSAELNEHVLDRAPDHTIYGATWQIFYELGIAADRNVDRGNSLLQEVVTRKEELYEPLMREFGAPVRKAVEFVKAMHVLTGGKLAIATGAKRSVVHEFLQSAGMTDYFKEECIFGHGDYERSKPDPQSFDLAFHSLGLPEAARSHVIAFEDDPKGIVSAKDAGLYVAAITTRFDRETLLGTEPAPDTVAGGFVDFADAIGITL